jgi:hypothetical protein
MYRPRTKNNKKKNQRAIYSNRPTNQLTITNNPTFGFINPRTKTTLKYATVLDFTVASLVGTQHIFRLNSIFDPDATGVGHQPYGHDTLALMYARYRVVRAAWHIEFHPSNDRLSVGVIPVNGTLATVVSNVTTFEQAAETPYAQIKALSFDGGVPAKFNGEISLNELLGQSPSAYLSDDRYQAVFGASPAEVVNLYLILYNPTSGSVTTSCNIQLWQESIVWDPIILAKS